MAKDKPISAKDKMTRPASPKDLAQLYEPYAIALGRLIFAWNHLQETLGQLFASLMKVENEAMLLAAWHSTQSDAAQRNMLRKACQVAPPTKLTDAQKADIEWLLVETNKLAELRNDAIHAPLIFTTDPTGTRLEPQYFYGNPRARNLVTKDLIHEFVLCRETADVLRGYAFTLFFRLRAPVTGLLSWPERPKLPNRGQRKDLGDRHHRVLPK